jgi:hypothetical protein
MQKAASWRLGFARVRVELPTPDSSRLVPAWAGSLGNNLLCANAPKEATVSVLRLGPLQWVALPGEPTAEAARAIEQSAMGARVVGLTDGYLGYVEDPLRVARGQGESRRQYFSQELSQVLAAGAATASQALARAQAGAAALR